MAKKSNDSVESLLESGLVALDAGNFDEALSQWNLALEQDPDNARAQRLVSDLEQLISDNRSGTMTPASVEFVVVVEDEADVQAAPEGVSPNVISGGYLDRIKKVSDDALADNAELSARLTGVQAELTEAKKVAASRETELAMVRQAALELEQAKNALETEKQDLTRFRRQHDRQAAELDLRLAERKASERRLLADIEKLAAERDALKGDIEQTNARATKLESDLAEQTAANRKAEGDQEKLREELEETRNALASERASLEESRGALEAANAKVAELEAKVEEGTAALEASKLETTKLQSDKDALEAAKAELETAKADLETKIEEASAIAAKNAEEITRLAAELAKAAVEAEERVNTATAALEESQAARSAMRTEMATIVQDLEKSKTRGDDLDGQLATAKAELEAKEGSSAEAMKSAEAKAIEAAAKAADLELSFNEASESLEAANAKVAELETQLASETKKQEHSAAAAAAQAAVETSAAHKAVSEAEAALAKSSADAEAKVASLTAELETLKAAATESAAGASKAGDLEKTNAGLLEELDGLRAQVMALEEKQKDVESSEELAQRLKDQDDAFTELQAQLMAKDVSIAELQSQLETRDQAHAAQQNASNLGAADLATKVADLEVMSNSLTTQLAAKDVKIAELESQAMLATRNTESPALQAEVDRLKVQLSAAEGRARSATEEVEELTEQVDSLKAAPIDMYVSGSYVSSERQPTPAENLSISGQFKAAEAAATPPLPPEARQAKASEDQGAAPLDSSAVSRLRDESLSPSDRLSWLIDEQPYVANTSSIPDLSARAAFVLQNIDGSVSFADLIDIVGLPEDETYSILLDLWDRGVITSPSLEP